MQPTTVNNSRLVPHGVMFHHFHDDKTHSRSQGSISEGDLERILDFLGKDKIRGPEVWLEKYESGKLQEGDVCITLDDSLRSQFDIALPVLEKHGIKAFWFIYSNVFEGTVNMFEVYRAFRTKYFEDIDGFYAAFFKKVEASPHAQNAHSAADENAIEDYRKIYPFYSKNDVRFRFIRDRVLPPDDYQEIMSTMISERGADVQQLSENLWMTNEHLKYLSQNGHNIGLHSYSHPMVMANVPPAEQENEYRKNYEHIARMTGRDPIAAAHPAGSYSNDTISILKKMGISLGFRSNMSVPKDRETINPNSLELAREDHASIMQIIN